MNFFSDTIVFFDDTVCGKNKWVKGMAVSVVYFKQFWKAGNYNTVAVFVTDDNELMANRVSGLIFLAFGSILVVHACCLLKKRFVSDLFSFFLCLAYTIF